MKSILITGINSFTGNYLSGLLKRKGYKVYGSVYKKQDESIKNNYFYANLFDLDSIKELVENVKPDKVIHLAAISFVSHENINELYNTNLLGTRNLLSSLEQSNKKPEQIILASSANIYGNVENEMIDEKYPFKPLNDYAISKASMELMANIWKEKLPITILRPFNYTGIGQSKKFLIPKIIHHFQMKKKFIELGNIEVFRDFSDVRDVAEIYSEILDLNLEGNI